MRVVLYIVAAVSLTVEWAVYIVGIAVPIAVVAMAFCSSAS